MDLERSVVFQTPEEGDRLWLTPDDKANFPAERCPTVVEFDAEGKGRTSFGFLHHKVKYDLLVYANLPDDVQSAAVSTADARFSIAESKVYGCSGKAYLRISLAFDGQLEGVHDTTIDIEAGGKKYVLTAHSQVLHDHQGHPALHAGVRNVTSLLDADTDAGSEWPGHGHDRHEEVAASPEK
eukprot:TRINITY_DN32748_c0_g1_i1.p2 TRINITY_DN32748_c0_g1~~TRINITY_DN32748_c0_g1_i1.p2  ORF type:complete len:214 (+),score=65.70 TRINITY_DN32748_c0_g1_i1:97-642(+)